MPSIFLKYLYQNPLKKYSEDIIMIDFCIFVSELNLFSFTNVFAFRKPNVKFHHKRNLFCFLRQIYRFRIRCSELWILNNAIAV